MLATGLERAALASEDHATASDLLNSATVVRVRAGGAARRGEPFEWRHISRSLWSANSPGGVLWDVVDHWRGWGVIVARWDRSDWVCSSLEDARAFAEEIEARPDFPERDWITDMIDFD